MSRYQFSMGGSSSPPRRRRGQPDLAREFEVVHATIEQAARVASAKLTELGVRHVLVGGLAVGAYARPRATKHVDFLVGAEAWPTRGIIVSPIADLPIRVGRVDVDHILAPQEAPGIDEALERGIESESIPVAPAEVIILMKLIADRPQDRADVDALLAVVDVDAARQYVELQAPGYVDDFDAALKEHVRGQGSNSGR